MYELVQAAGNTFYMDCPSKVGFFRSEGGEVVLIDSGSDRDAGKKVKRILERENWTLKAIYNTHAHADHIGGNQYLQTQTGCRIFASGVESAAAEYPILEPTALYGGFAPMEMHSKFLLAKESSVERLTEKSLPDGMELLSLPGHSYDMAGFRTRDGVVFLADCLAAADTLEKYRIIFLYDVKAYLETLEMVKGLEAECFIPAHAPQTDEIAPLAQLNIERTLAVAEDITKAMSEPMTFEDLLADLFGRYGLVMNLQQRMLLGSTVKSYLSYLKDAGQIGYSFENNRMLWARV